MKKTDKDVMQKQLCRLGPLSGSATLPTTVALSEFYKLFKYTLTTTLSSQIATLIRRDKIVKAHK